MRVKIDLERLKQIAEITKPARNGNGSWKSYAYIRHKDLLDKAADEYMNFLMDLIEDNIGPLGNNLIDITKISLSRTATDLISQILLPVDFLVFAPRVDDDLNNDECEIDEMNVLVDKETRLIQELNEQFNTYVGKE